MVDKPRFVGERVKLGDVCTIVSGATPKTKTDEYWGGEIRWVTPAELDGDSHYISDTEKHLTEAGYKSASLHMMPKGTVLLTTRAPIGKVAIAAEEMSCNQGFKNLVCSSAINNEFLYLYLKSRTAELQAMGRGATFKELSKKNVAGFEINLPAIDRQLDAVARLTAVGSQIALAKQQHDQLDSLVKSRFVEMFGDPCDPGSGKERSRIDSFCELRIGPFGSALHKEDYVSDGHPLVNPSNIANGTVVPDWDLTINDDKYESLAAYWLFPGDVVLGRRGEIGRCAVVGRGGMICGTGSMILRPGRKVRSDYLQRVISFPSFSRVLESNAVGVTMKNLNAKIVGSAEVHLPKLEDQDAFAAFVTQVDKSRFVACFGWGVG